MSNIGQSRRFSPVSAAWTSAAERKFCLNAIKPDSLVGIDFCPGILDVTERRRSEAAVLLAGDVEALRRFNRARRRTYRIGECGGGLSMPGFEAEPYKINWLRGLMTVQVKESNRGFDEAKRLLDPAREVLTPLADDINLATPPFPIREKLIDFFSDSLRIVAN